MQRRKQLLWEIERQLAEDNARPIIFYPPGGTCLRPMSRALEILWAGKSGRRSVGWGRCQSWEATMPASGSRPGQVAVESPCCSLRISELSCSTWLITSLAPAGGDKMSKHSVRGGDIAELLNHLAKLRDKAHARAGASFPIIAIQEAGLDGFSVHRVLERAGIDSHVVDAASILTSRRRRRVKTDRIDGEVLLRTLLVYKRGEPVSAPWSAPSPGEEDRRRLCRERKTLVAERVAHVNRIKGLLSPRASAITNPCAVIGASGWRHRGPVTDITCPAPEGADWLRTRRAGIAA